MTPRTGIPRLVLFGLAGLAVFSALFSYAIFRGWWPTLPPGTFHDTDLWFGFAGVLGIVCVLLFSRGPRTG